MGIYGINMKRHCFLTFSFYNCGKTTDTTVTQKISQQAFAVFCVLCFLFWKQTKNRPPLGGRFYWFIGKQAVLI